MKRPLALAAFALLVLGAATAIPPYPDETYYWTWSRAPALRYFDHPPGVALALAAVTRALGDGIMAVRALALASMAATIAMCAAASRRLGGRAETAVLVLCAAPMFVIGLIPMTPDPLHVAATALGAYLVVRAHESWAWASAAAFVLIAAIGIKHYAALIALGAALGLATTAEGRRALVRGVPGVALGLLVLAPWLWAELAADGGSFAFQAGRVFGGDGASRGVVAIPLVVGSMAGTLGPMAVVALFACASPVGAARVTVHRALFGGAFALIFGCVVAVWDGSGQANWPLPALVFALPSIAAGLEARPRLARAVQAGSFACALLAAVYLLHVARPFLPIPDASDPAARGVGFEEIAREVSRQAERHGARVVVTRRYQHASLLRYHLHDRLPVLELGSARGRKSQYDLWERPRLCAGDVVIVATPTADLPGEIDATPLAPSVSVERRRPGRPTFGEWWVTPLTVTRGAYEGARPCPLEPAASR